MLQNLLVRRRRKKTLADYKKSTRFWSLLLFLFATLTLFLVFKLKLHSFGKGFLIGVASGLLLIVGRNLYLLRNNKKLKEAYLKAYDERNNQILLLASAVILSLQLVVISLGLVLYAIWSIKWSMLEFLIIDLYLILFGLITVKTILGKLM
ncbi:hypothetical protein [Streptococcus catagoni]|uniref:hypothetical protein n=1 Tax=Streptococcus catagoni TaxID=2654874 RepID=UPI00140C7A9C|nr:hypothetical protein [Streptococcus catagoni]